MTKAIFGLVAISVLAAAPAFAGSGTFAGSTSVAGSSSGSIVVGAGSARSYSFAGNVSGAQAQIGNARGTSGVSTYSIGGTATGSHVWGNGAAGSIAGQGGGAVAGIGQLHH